MCGMADDGFKHKLIPIFSDVIAPDADMAALIDAERAPFKADLETVIANSESLLYRRGNFQGTWDDVICNAIMADRDTVIAMSPGVRWGDSIMPGQDITREDIHSVCSMTWEGLSHRNDRRDHPHHP